MEELTLSFRTVDWENPKANGMRLSVSAVAAHAMGHDEFEFQIRRMANVLWASIKENRMIESLGPAQASPQ